MKYIFLYVIMRHTGKSNANLLVTLFLIIQIDFLNILACITKKKKLKISDIQPEKANIIV